MQLSRSMSSLLLILATSLLFNNSANAQNTPADNNDDPKKMATVGGLLHVKSDESDGFSGTNYLYLNKRKVDGLEDDHINLIRKISIDGIDVVIAKTNCGGSGCSLSQYSFITVTPKGATLLSKEAIFGSEGDVPKIEVADKKIKLTVTERTGRRSKSTSWVYSDGTVGKEGR